MITYFIKSTICLTVLLLCYQLLLSRSKLFLFNRYFLLFSILFSLLIPKLNITLDDHIMTRIPGNIFDLRENSTFYKIPNLHTGYFEEIINKPTLTLTNILYFVYFLILATLLIRFVKNFIKLLRQNKKYQKVYYQGNKIVLLDFKTNPYTFFNTIFVFKEDFQNGFMDKDILRHEIEHKKQLHSIDILVLELIQIVYWFNPLIYLYKLAVKTNHEYLADNSIILSGIINHIDYSRKIINYTFQNRQVSLVSQTDYLLTKKRIIMLATKKNTKMNLSRITVLFPIVMFLFISMAFVINKNGIGEIHAFVPEQEKLTSNDFKTFTNSELGIQFKYPVDWYEKTSNRPDKQDGLHLERLNIENSDGTIIQSANDFVASKSVIVIDIYDTKILYVKGLTNKSTKIKTIEDWVKYGFDPWSEDVMADKNAIEKRMSNIRLGTIGEKELKLWQDKTPTWKGTDFVYKGIFYRIIMQSGSEDQMQKDLHVYEKILETFKIN